MPRKPFRDPKIRLNKIYTRTGDHGNTRLAGGQSLPKDHDRIQAYGNVDELNAMLGICRESCTSATDEKPELNELTDWINRIQHELFNLGAYLATLPEDIRPDLPRLSSQEVTLLETEIDRLNTSLPELTSFVLPGGSDLNAKLHLARTVCRRTERSCVSLASSESVDKIVVTYLNRLSDALFVWSRWVNRVLEVPEILWNPHKTPSGNTPK